MMIRMVVFPTSTHAVPMSFHIISYHNHTNVHSKRHLPPSTSLLSVRFPTHRPLPISPPPLPSLPNELHPLFTQLLHTTRPTRYSTRRHTPLNSPLRLLPILLRDVFPFLGHIRCELGLVWVVAYGHADAEL